MEERVTMTTRELDRLKVLQQALQHTLTWPQAAAQLRLSVRQVGRLCVRLRTEGPQGLVHRLRGRPSNHRVPLVQLERALTLIKTRYPDFGPTLAAEKLRQQHRLLLSPWSLRQAMIRAGLWRARARSVPHRAWRPRRACVGELVQLDGSTHAWLEARGPRCVLLTYVDDATSRLLYAEFVAVEDTATLLRTTQVYLRRVGRPGAFYVDKDSIYRVNRQASIEEQLQEVAPLTQFTRAMTELGIAVITAHSPQAKGRVERAFGTHQDRLVKELRLVGISTLPEANRFLRTRYQRAHNARFAVEPANPTNAHRRLLPGHDLAAICSVQTVRQLERDFTVRLHNQFFQLQAEQPVRLRPRDPVLLEQRLDGSIHLRAKGRYLAAHAIPKSVPRSPRKALPWRGPRHVPHPSMTHPWKARLAVALRRNNAARLTKENKSTNHDSSILFKP